MFTRIVSRKRPSDKLILSGLSFTRAFSKRFRYTYHAFFLELLSFYTSTAKAVIQKCFYFL